MVKQTVKSSLAAKIEKSTVKVFETHKTDEPKYDTGGNLPAGIEGGVAQLVDCKFGVYEKGDNKGEFFFYAAGVVVSPDEHEGVRIKGLRTQFGPEPICTTTKADGTEVSQADHLLIATNQMKLLGAEISEDTKVDDLEAIAAGLVEAAPFFRFRTWKGKKATEGPYKDLEPRTRHVWGGVCEFEGEGESGVEEEVQEEEAEEEEKKTKPGKKPGNGPSKGSGKTKKEPTLEELGEAADGDDEDAQTKLGELAEKAGLDVEEYEDWAAIAEALANPKEEEEEEEGEEEAETEEPSKGDVYKFKPPKAKKAVECEVTLVNKKAETVSLKNLDDGKFYKDVAWSDLEQV